MKKNLSALFIIGLALQSALFGQTNYALTFDNGSSQFIRVLYTDTLQPKNAVTVEAWVNVGLWTGYPGIVGNTEFGGYELEIDNNRFHFYIKRNGNYADAYVAQSEVSSGWHHYAGTFDGRYSKLYLDGVLKFTDDAGLITQIQYSNHNSLIIGAEAGSGIEPYGYYFSGSIDEVRIWDIARPIDSIFAAMHRELAGSEPNLIGYWPLNEGSGTTANDLTTYHNNGTLVNSPAWITTVTPLPVELTSFSANAKSAAVELSWKTATETNNYGFEVERKAHPNPSQREGLSLNQVEEWEALGFIKGNGNSNSPKEYFYEDTDILLNGKYSYRLKQIDIDGRYKFSDEIEVNLATPKNFRLNQNYPNPFNPITTISYQLPQNSFVTMKVCDALGREVFTLVNEEKTAGTYSVTFNASLLSSGVYFCRLQAGEFVQMKKMILMK